MALEFLISEFADYCPVCMDMALLSWSDSDLGERICDDCAECLVSAEHTLLMLNLDRPPSELVERNP
jgi:hypothetical protein